eukprot:scaffold986_cov237-Pinguiococcus_pyrenoidosus.AAC.11
MEVDLCVLESLLLHRHQSDDPKAHAALLQLLEALPTDFALQILQNKQLDDVADLQYVGFLASLEQCRLERSGAQLVRLLVDAGASAPAGARRTWAVAGLSNCLCGDAATTETPHEGLLDIADIDEVDLLRVECELLEDRERAYATSPDGVAAALTARLGLRPRESGALTLAQVRKIRQLTQRSVESSPAPAGEPHVDAAHGLDPWLLLEAANDAADGLLARLQAARVANTRDEQLLSSVGLDTLLILEEQMAREEDRGAMLYSLLLQHFLRHCEEPPLGFPCGWGLRPLWRELRRWKDDRADYSLRAIAPLAELLQRMKQRYGMRRLRLMCLAAPKPFQHSMHLRQIIDVEAASPTTPRSEQRLCSALLLPGLT